MTAMTMTMTSASSRAVVWRRIGTGDQTVAVAQRDALGTTARLAVWPPEQAEPAMAAVDGVLAALDRQASRFRPDSEISWLHRSADGGLFMLSDGLAEAVRVALDAARWTDGLTDPTVGQALISLGYDRDFLAIDPDSQSALPAPLQAPGWWRVRLDGSLLRLPAGLRLDLGATAKGLGSDRAARAVLAVAGHPGGVLISLGGDIATAGIPPRDGWPITAGLSDGDGADSPGTGPASTALTQLVRLPRGGVATSSIGCRSWRRAGRVIHHIVDPRTGLPADGPWQTASVAAMTCADANAAATAAIVAGDQAVDWLTAAGLPARLVSHDGQVRYLGGWPERDGGRIEVPQRTWVYAGTGPRAGVR